MYIYVYNIYIYMIEIYSLRDNPPAHLFTFCSSLHRSKKFARVTASSIFLKGFVLPHQTRPSVCAQYLVCENKQFECPVDLRECSFGVRFDVSVAHSN